MSDKIIKNKGVPSAAKTSENGTTWQGEIIVYQKDDSVRMEVLTEDGTIWLTQPQIAELFDAARSNIAEHIKNIYCEEELTAEATCRNFRHVRTEGTRQVIRTIPHYNLDMIISIGYRVNSKRATKFRQWANVVLKEYIIKGYAVNQRFERLEHRLADHDEKFDLLFHTSQPQAQGIFNEGQIFDAHVFASNLIRSAKRSIVLLDNYADDSVLLLLSVRNPGVSAEIITKRILPQFRMHIEKHNAQYEEIRVHEIRVFHDRFLIIDNDVYHIGASLKDLGKKLFAFSKMEEKGDEFMKRLKK